MTTVSTKVEEKPNEQEEEQQEVKPEEKKDEEGEKEKKTFRSLESDNDKKTITSAQRIHNQMFGVEDEKVDIPKEEQVAPIMFENGVGERNFSSDGQEKTMMIFPPDNMTDYSIAFVNSSGKVVQEVNKINGVHKARINFIKGDYKIVVKARGIDMPFTCRMI